MKNFNLAEIHKDKEKKDMEELTHYQMNTAVAGRPMALSACIDFCYVTNDMIGEIMYFTS